MRATLDQSLSAQTCALSEDTNQSTDSLPAQLLLMGCRIIVFRSIRTQPLATDRGASGVKLVLIRGPFPCCRATSSNRDVATLSSSFKVLMSGGRRMRKPNRNTLLADIRKLRNNQRQLHNSLKLLFGLLEKYSPIWYPKHYHNRAKAALKNSGTDCP